MLTMRTNATLTVLFSTLLLAGACGASDSPANPSPDTDNDTGLADTASPGDDTGSTDTGSTDTGEPTMTLAQRLQSDTPREAPTASEADLEALISDQTSFALWMYHRGVETAGADENFLFSPISIATAFGMLWPGAVGETADEIAAMLHFGLSADRFHSAGNRLAATLEARNDYEPGEDEGDAPILEITNDLWGLDDYPYVDAYVELLARHYGAGMWIVDFLRDPEAARVEINAYIASRTRGLITELLPEGSIDDGTRLVLTNVVYFKGAWLTPFEDDRTEPAPFTALDGTVADVPMMRNTIERARHARVGDTEVVELDYVGDGLSMVLIVPDAGTFAALEAGLDAAALTALLDAPVPTEGVLAMPKFAFEAELDLVPIFEAAGFSRPFTGGVADFSGLSEIALQEELHVTGAFHKARIILDEEGTEAAAATAIVVGTESAPLETFNVTIDRPFLFVLRDRPTGAVLFMGRVVDAAAAQD